MEQCYVNPDGAQALSAMFFAFSLHKAHTMKLTLAVIATLTALAAATPAVADEALAKAKNCMTCHSVDKKLVGPAFKDIGKKNAGDGAAADKLASKIMKGSSGVWGAVPMPANATVSDADAKKLAGWILTLK